MFLIAKMPPKLPLMKHRGKYSPKREKSPKKSPKKSHKKKKSPKPAKDVLKRGRAQAISDIYTLRETRFNEIRKKYNELIDKAEAYKAKSRKKQYKESHKRHILQTKDRLKRLNDMQESYEDNNPHLFSRLFEKVEGGFKRKKQSPRAATVHGTIDNPVTPRSHISIASAVSHESHIPPVEVQRALLESEPHFELPPAGQPREPASNADHRYKQLMTLAHHRDVQGLWPHPTARDEQFYEFWDRMNHHAMHGAPRYPDVVLTEAKYLWNHLKTGLPVPATAEKRLNFDYFS
jgi:hypothetical protein